jgi:phenylacetate-CoA ligase
MNLVGKSYLTVRSHIQPASRRTLTRQQELSDQFLTEWQAHRNINGSHLLREALDHARRYVPFYRKYFADNPTKDPMVLRDWPILTRDLLRSEFENLKSLIPVQGKSWTHASGGSTGKPVAVVHDEYFAARAQALRDLCAQLFFEGPHYNKLILWGMSEELEKVKNGDNSLAAEFKSRLLQLAGLKTSHINTFDFTQEKFEKCVGILKSQKPDFIFGYAGSVYQLAKYMDERGLQPARSPVKIGTTAQTLYPFMREKIESVFGCKVCDHYGSREVGPIAWQHDNGDMYFPDFFSKVEVVNAAGRPCSPGERGRVLVTTLHNFAMPLIRYEVGDTGVQGTETSFQGYPFSTLTQVTGKSNEEFVTKTGSLVHGQFFINLFYYRPWLDEFHVVQKEHSLIEILYVLKSDTRLLPNKDVADIESRIRKVMGENCVVHWRKVQEIPPTKAGKRLYVRSEVKQAQAS